MVKILGRKLRLVKQEKDHWDVYENYGKDEELFFGSIRKIQKWRSQNTSVDVYVAYSAFRAEYDPYSQEWHDKHRALQDLVESYQESLAERLD